MKDDNYAVLRILDFRNYVIARFLAVVGIQVQAVVVGWQVFDKTNDPLALGLVGLFEIIPAISVALFAGHLADLKDRKTIVLICYFVLLFCSASLLLLSTSILNLPANNVYPIYGIIFISGIARGFLNPTLAAFMAQLVPKHYYPNSSAWNSIAWQVAAVCGPALGGILYGFNGPILAYAVDASLLIAAIVFYMRILPKPLPERKQGESIFESLFTGFRFVFSNQVMLAAMSLDMFAVLFGGAVALLPVFAKDILNVGPEGLGILRASPAFGASIMAILLAHKPPRENAGQILLIAVAGFGVCMLLFGISSNFYLSVFLLGMSGVFDSVSVVLRSTIMQTFTPETMRGRVASVNSIFIGSSNELGAFESGVTAKIMGAIPSVVFGGIMTMLIVMITGAFAPKLRKLNFKEENSDSK
ncbi:MAG TPA: MFS transporter [Leptospiraceae bacterium]|nr:MFS transporter [Leptospiraceae bacterium]HMW03578.1 MFS transporter [Leptospiraceae bacterium]HMX32319.1 MFS transporter [Leptospiraceae bacterium]HMY29501.1 MFS transporter [Leptospiraceae bacterium]HMZ63578.1 MFS transporter [Leptospiraceae bacterium]